MQKITVSSNEAGQRLDKLLGKYLSNAPMSFVYKMLRHREQKSSFRQILHGQWKAAFGCR